MKFCTLPSSHVNVAKCAALKVIAPSENARSFSSARSKCARHLGLPARADWWAACGYSNNRRGHSSGFLVDHRQASTFSSEAQCGAAIIALRVRGSSAISI